MINLTSNEKNAILKASQLEVSVQIEQRRKFVKKANEFNLFGELLGMRISRLIGLHCPKYDFASINNVKYLLSDDIGEGGIFILANEMFNIESNSLYDIQSEIKKYFPNEEKKLMKDIVKIYIMDILTMNFDRNLRNWGIKIINGKPEVWIFDNEYVFLNDGFPVIYFNKYTSDLKHEQDINSFLINISEDVKNFLNSKENFYQYLFPEILLTLTPTVIDVMSRKVVKEVGESYSDELFINQYHEVHECFTNMIC